MVTLTYIFKVSWDTTNFVNGDFDLHFHGHDITFFTAGRNAIIVVEILLKLVQG